MVAGVQRGRGIILQHVLYEEKEFNEILTVTDREALYLLLKSRWSLITASTKIYQKVISIP